MLLSSCRKILKGDLHMLKLSFSRCGTQGSLKKLKNKLKS